MASYAKNNCVLAGEPILSQKINASKINIIYGQSEWGKAITVFENTLMVYVWPVWTLSKEYNPNELVVTVRDTFCGSVILTTAFLRPRPSGVVMRPLTVTVFRYRATATSMLPA